MATILQVQQRAQVFIRYTDDIPALAAVTPIRTALGHELLPAKAHTAIAAVTGGNLDGNFVDKLHRRGLHFQADKERRSAKVFHDLAQRIGDLPDLAFGHLRIKRQAHRRPETGLRFGKIARPTTVPTAEMGH